MICLGYLSSAVGELSSQELSAILNQSQHNNSEAGLTGLLCYHEGSFLQFLEGDADAVIETYARITLDPRHRGLIEICRRPISERAFGEWSMGVVNVKSMGPAEQAFCQSLRDIQVTAPVAQRDAIEPFLTTFRSWIR